MINLFLFSMLVAHSSFAASPPKVTTAIQNSHINANAPEYHTLEDRMVRDLETYFNEKLNRKDVRVTSELLRQEATQSGVAYPKYYSWVRVKESGGKLITSGAVRVEAIEQETFRVTNFVPSESIKSGAGKIEEIFPALLCDSIRSHANDK